MSETFECLHCAEPVPPARWALGYRLCLLCGEDAARVARASWCVVQEYGKGNYQFVTPSAAVRTLRETNQKNPR